MSVSKIYFWDHFHHVTKQTTKIKLYFSYMQGYGILNVYELKYENKKTL